MHSKKNLYRTQIKFIQIFLSPDPQNDDLDTVFEIDGKKLYANKSRLTIISPTFESMLSERWTSKNDEPIQIKDYKFEDFKEFLTFIYSGECSFNDDNIFALIDMAEFYGVDIFKIACAQFLSKIKYTMENVLIVLETSNKYSMIDVKNCVYRFISTNFMDFIKSKNILKITKEIFEELITFVRAIVKPEELFQAVYEWNEYQAQQKVKRGHFRKKLNIVEFKKMVQTEITPFLPSFEFKKMNIDFVVGYIVQRSFLFSSDELRDILNKSGANSFRKVKITNLNGESIYGYLPKNSDSVKVIQSLKNCLSNNMDCGTPWWNTKSKIPTTPSSIKKRDGAEWYLVYFPDGDIGARRSSEIKQNDYLLAELTAEFTEFYVTHHCKIEIK